MVRIVCLGDSIAGAYYHTGGRRAWPELLGDAARPTTKLATYARIVGEVGRGAQAGPRLRLTKGQLNYL